SGVKMHSALFALNPATAASLFLLFLKDQCEFKDAEIMDVDEESFRKGEMKVKLFAYARTPYRKVLLQGRKSVFESVNEELAKDEIARYLEEIVEEKDTLFILGPGTTTARVAEHLGIKKTLLGVDLIKNKTLFAKDVNEKEILTYLNKFKKAKIIVSVIGSQGFVFGRGNQQISAEVIKKVGKNNIFILATPEKLRETEVLRVDTGDENLDKELAGYVRVISGYHEMVLRKIELPQA
ncbi:MAG TPA: ATP-NAD kinase, partial [Thermoplasmata archaeon]|nr:ATP-NAD kinase [Thermoplasmata archaeon]